MKKFRIITCISGIVFLAAALSCGGKKGMAKDGTYTGTAIAHNGPLTVEVGFAKGVITSVTVTQHTETKGVSENAIAKVSEAIVKNNSTNVDSVSGATITSYAIKTAVQNAIEQAGGQPGNYAKEVSKANEGDKTLECDVVVIGAGGGGITAAARAQEQGAKVILIEKNGQVGGDTALNAGTLIATGSKFQREQLKETKDSPELAYSDIMRIGKNVNDPVLVSMITKTIGKTVDWLIDDMKVPYNVAATQYPDHSANRQIGVVGRSPAFFAAMQKNFENLGGTLLLETKGESLIFEDGEVKGVTASDKSGAKITIKAASTVIASGGYGANAKLLPNTLTGYMFYGRSTDTGDGFTMAKAIGIDTINLDCVKVYAQGVETTPGRALAATASSTAASNGHGTIYVNTKGVRVVNETGTLAAQTEATVAQSDKILYLLMDEDAYRAYVAKSLEDKLVASENDIDKWYNISNDGKPVIAKSANLDELAKTMGIDASALQTTVAKYNDNCAKGVDPEFGKKNPVALASGGTYYIVEQRPRFSTTLGGLKADASMQLLSGGKPVKNLYGAGSVVGGANGRDSMTAMMNSWAIGSGRIAGENAAKNAGK